jgi:hypothetical protein
LIVKPGTVAYWRDLFPGENKFVFLLGTFEDESGCERVAYFTISSQTKWAALPKTRREMVDIPRGTLVPHVALLHPMLVGGKDHNQAALHRTGAHGRHYVSR